MNAGLSVRVDKKLRGKLRRMARALSQSESELVRRMLDRELEPKPLGERIAHLKGALGPAIRPPDEWEKKLREHNWRL